MQQYLRKSRLSGVLDDLGLRAVIALAAFVWFVLLWGLGVPSVAAGLALGLLGQMALTRYRRDTALAREEALRRRLGGELLLEEMLLLEPAKAHAEAAALLKGSFPELSIVRVEEAGALCRYGGDTLLVVMLARPEGSLCTAEDAAAAARACKRLRADRAVLCLSCRCDGRAAAFSEDCPVPVRILGRDRMVGLAGQAHPITDEQLVALGARKKRLTPSALLRGAIRRDKAKRYMMYGLGLMGLYILTGLKYYPAPGAVCLTLAAWCRCAREETERL